MQKGRKVRNVDIKIPAGIKDGGKIRITGEGNPGTGGGPSGDLYLVVNIEPHNFFTRKGSDLHCEVPVNLKEAYKGGKIDVPTFDGKINVKLPAKTQGGKTLRLKGKGMPKLRGGGNGDLYIKTKLVLPDKLSLSQKKKFDEFLKKYDENPRKNIIV